MNFASYFAIEKRLKNQGFDFERGDLIRQFSNGKKSGLKSLTEWEYAEFLRWLNMRFQVQQKPPQPHPEEQSPENRMRRKIIALFRQMGYNLNGRADMQRINSWCISSGAYKKVLNAHTYQELTVLVTQAENYFKKHFSK